MRVWYRSGYRLQLIDSPELRDHCPIVVWTSTTSCPSRSRSVTPGGISRNSDVQLTDTQARKFFCEKCKHHWPLCHRLRMMFVCRGTLSITSSVDWHAAFSRNLGRDALNGRQTHNKLPSKPCWQGRITEMHVVSYDASNSQRSQCTSLGQRGRNTCISKPCSVTPSSSVGEIGDIKWTTWCSNYSKRYVTKTLLCNGSSPTRSPAASMGRRSGVMTIPNVFVPQHKSGFMNCHLQDRKAAVRQHGLTKLLLTQSSVCIRRGQIASKRRSAAGHSFRDGHFAV